MPPIRQPIDEDRLRKHIAEALDLMSVENVSVSSDSKPGEPTRVRIVIEGWKR